MANILLYKKESIDDICKVNNDNNHSDPLTVCFWLLSYITDAIYNINIVYSAIKQFIFG